MFCSAQNFNVRGDLRRHVESLCDVDLQGRAPGSLGERDAAEYVFEALRGAGVTMLTDENGQDFKMDLPQGELSSLNIVGAVPGSDRNLREEYIVVGAHFDGPGCNVIDVNGEKNLQIYSGADGDASGVAIMIELAKMAAQYSFMFPRTIIFVGFGASEKGNAGSWYFANRAFEQIGSVKAMINLDMVGRGGAENPFQLFSQLSRKDLEFLVNRTAEQPVVLTPSLDVTDVAPSDHLPFYEKKIPVFYFTTGLTREYHTLRDTPQTLSYADMEMACNYIYHFLMTLASEESLPQIDQEGKVTREIKSDKIYSQGECDKKPQFFHSTEVHFLQNWVYKYLRYPQSAIDEGIRGTVVVSFIVEKDGTVTGVNIENSLDPRLDDEVLRVVNVSPKWIPGQIGGKKVRTRIVLPVEFRLTGKSKFGIKK